MILALYADDIVLLARDPQALRRIKAALAQAFKMKDLGEIQNVLGLRVQRHRATRRLWIDQTHYIEDVLKEFGHVDCRTVSTLADGYENLQAATAQDTLFANVALYQRALGQLNWLVRGTRPDLAFVVHKLSQFCHKPYAPHWAGVRRVFRYLNYSRHLRLCYTGDTQEMAADYLTKPLKRQKFTANLGIVGLYEDTEGGGTRRTQPHAEWGCCE